MIYRDPRPFLCIDTQTGVVNRYIRPAPKLLHQTCIAQLTDYEPFKPINAEELERFRVVGWE